MTNKKCLFVVEEKRANDLEIFKSRLYFEYNTRIYFWDMLKILCSKYRGFLFFSGEFLTEGGGADEREHSTDAGRRGGVYK